MKYSAIADAVQAMEEERVEKELRVGRDGGGQPTAIALAFADVATKAVAKTRGVRWRPHNPPPRPPSFSDIPFLHNQRAAGEHTLLAPVYVRVCSLCAPSRATCRVLCL